MGTANQHISLLPESLFSSSRYERGLGVLLNTYWKLGESFACPQGSISSSSRAVTMGATIFYMKLSSRTPAFLTSWSGSGHLSSDMLHLNLKRSRSRLVRFGTLLSI